VLTRAKTFLESELERLQKEMLDADRLRGRSGARDSAEGELHTMREMLSSSQQMGKDLRAMVHSAETMAESLKRELTAARRDAADASTRAAEAVRHADAQAAEAVDKSEKVTNALTVGQRELAKMHQYCVDMAARLQAANDALSREKATSRHLQRQVDDLKAVAAAQAKFALAMGSKAAASIDSHASVPPVFSPMYRAGASGRNSSASRSASLPQHSHDALNHSL
jgi:DNA repair exonuclease SbcCD ATPase subunit